MLINRYFICFSYNGETYSGWQRQPNALSVQEIMENCFSKKLGEICEITAAGRTDAGVHAKHMVAHLDSKLLIDSDFIWKMNAFLPNSIFIKNVYLVENDAHARFSAESRTYQYFISENKDPFGEDFIWQTHFKLNVDEMNAAALYLLKFTDFTSFSKLHTDTKTNDCTITQAQFGVNENGTIVFTITANRFLRNMVRAIVGSLVDVGRNKISVSDFISIIESKNRANASMSAPAHALFLTDIVYPNHIFLRKIH